MSILKKKSISRFENCNIISLYNNDNFSTVKDVFLKYALFLKFPNDFWKFKEQSCIYYDNSLDDLNTSVNGLLKHKDLYHNAKIIYECHSHDHQQ